MPIVTVVLFSIVYLYTIVTSIFKAYVNRENT